MRAEGHAVGLHCDEHVRHSERDAAWLARDTDAALRRLAGVGVRPAFWRTPWGDTAPWSAQIARRRKLRLIGWTADSHDWRGDGAAEMFEATRESLTDGAIVLAHDGLGPGARRDSVEATLDYVGLRRRARPRPRSRPSRPWREHGHVRPSSTWRSSTRRSRGSRPAPTSAIALPVPPFPEEAIADLEAVGALAWNAQPGTDRPPAAAELGLVRSIARADGSVGRIVDGHLNGVERLAVQAPPDLRDRELAAVRAGRLRVGVWGGDPRPGEGTPAAMEATGSGEVLTGVEDVLLGRRRP